jgi:hypothetical protein
MRHETTALESFCLTFVVIAFALIIGAIALIKVKAVFDTFATLDLFNLLFQVRS